jgi:hypothetical protein
MENPNEAEMARGQPDGGGARDRFFFWRPYGEWLCSHPLLPLEALLLVAIICFAFGKEFGAPDLFWHKDWWSQFQAGFGTALVLGQLCFVGYLLDAGKPWWKQSAPPLPWHWHAATFLPTLMGRGVLGLARVREAAQWRKLCWYLAVTWVPLLVAVAVPALFDPAGRYPFLLGMLALIAATRLTIFIFLHLPRVWSPKPIPTVLRRKHLAPEEQQLDLLATLYFGLLFGVYLLLVFTGLGALVAPALALCILLGLVALVYGFIAFRFPRVQLPLFVLIVAFLVVVNGFGPRHKLRFAGLDAYYDDQVVSLAGYDQQLQQEDGAGDDALIRDRAALNAWHQRLGAGKPKLVVVATQGGGIRAAVWTAVVLRQLEEDQRLSGFPRHVRLVCGASGGMLGAAYYTATLGPGGGHADRRGNRLELADLVKDLEKDSLTPLAQGLVLRDLPMLFVPLPYSADRGQALEEAWEEHTGGVLAMPFRALARGEREGWRPSLILSPMLVEDGRRLLISNLNLRPMVVSQGSFLFPEGNGGRGAAGNEQHAPARRKQRKVPPTGGRQDRARYSLSAFEFFRLFPQASGFKLSTAVRMNASFAYASPAVALPTQPRRRVVDAGYYDNYGVNLAAAWLARHRAWLAGHTSGVVLIQIRDYLKEAERRGDVFQREGGGSPLSRGLEEATGPVLGFLAAQESESSFRNDEQVEQLDLYFTARKKDSFFTTVVFECPQQIALSWYLTDEAIEAIEGGFHGGQGAADSPVRRNVESLKRLEDWWVRGNE